MELGNPTITKTTVPMTTTTTLFFSGTHRQTFGRERFLDLAIRQAPPKDAPDVS